MTRKWMPVIFCTVPMIAGTLNAQVQQAEPLAFSAKVSNKDGIFRCRKKIGFQFNMTGNAEASSRLRNYICKK